MSVFDFEGKTIYYETYGQGKPLLLLNGIMMSCASWKEFIEPFSAENQLILVDMLDQGKSAKMERESYEESLQVEVIHALAEHLGLSSLSIAGVSYGGEIALQFALKYPRQLERLVLFNTTSRTGEWLGTVGQSWIASEKDADQYFLATMPFCYSPSYYKSHYKWMEERRKALRPVFSNPEFMRAMDRLTKSSISYDVTDRLSEIHTPTLVVSCLEDGLTPVKEQQTIISKLPDRYYVVIPESGHCSMYEQPLLYASLILGFVNNQKLVYNV